MLKKLIEFVGSCVVILLVIAGIVAIHNAFVGTVSGSQNARPSDEPDEVAVQHARDFLDGDGCGRFILQYLHLYQTYTSHTWVGTRTVLDDSGEKIPGQFALLY